VLGKLSLSVRFLFYFIVGNFYVINLVYLLQLLKISNRLTLLAATLLPVIKALSKNKETSFKKSAQKCYEVAYRLFSGKYGLRLLLLRGGRLVGRVVAYFTHGMRMLLKHRLVDCIWFVGFLGLIVFFYGHNLIYHLGYGASDIPVHTQWVNAMEYQLPWKVDYSLGSAKAVLDSWNNIFVKGVYPFGLHNLIYYLHAVFGIDTYVLFRVFWLVQDTLIFLFPIITLKALCKTKYAPYLGTLLYLLLSLSNNVYSRYYASLPQEAGMLFIIPTGFFLLLFLGERKMEIQQASKESFKKLLSTKYLAVFAMSLSLTLTTHFYDTFAVAFMCLGIAGAFFFRIFRKGYFGRILLAGILSILIGALPLVLGMLVGKGAQGSLGWGINIITGANKEKEEESGEAGEGESSEEESSQGSIGADGTQESGGTWNQGNDTATGHKTDVLQLLRRVGGVIERGYTFFQNMVIHSIFGSKPILSLWALWVPLGVLILGGLAAFLCKKTDYGGILWSAAFHQILLLILLCLGALGLPELMDNSRASVYFAYGLPLLWSLTLDCVISLCFGRHSENMAAGLVTVGCMIGIFTLVVTGKMVRGTYVPSTIWQTNGTITSLTNIIRDRKDDTWTICSANDVTQLVFGHGYHYEAISFLQDLQSGRSTPQPTEWVYFFVEKVPIDYNLSYEGSGQSVSKEGADMQLPYSSGVMQYQGENRWIIMSKLYYWGKDFMDRFPNQVRVYYETDEFICYEIRQNINRVFNFAISDES
jgi:hypothetical protein